MQSVFKAVLTLSIIFLVLTDLISIICMIDNLNDLRIYINNPDYFSDDSFGAPKSAMGLVFAIGFMALFKCGDTMLQKNNIFSGLILKLINTDRRIPDIKMPDRICGNKILSRTEIDHVFK